MREISFTVPKEYEGTMVKVFLRRAHNVSAGVLKEAKKHPAGILVNGKPEYAVCLLHAGDIVTFLTEEKVTDIPPVPFPLQIHYEDNDFLLVDKPSGMPMYPTPGHDADSLGNAVSCYLQEKGKTPVFYPLYRLDRDTTGLMLLAKNSYCASAAASFVEKEYTGICEGAFYGSGKEDGFIKLLPGHTVQRCVSTEGEFAVTNWKTVATGKDHTLVHFRLETGRTHQIRVHMSYKGHPLAGDDMYGGGREKISRQALHVSWLRVFHPVQERWLEFVSDLPIDMQKLWEDCR